MEKAGGRPRDEVWKRVTLLEGGRRVKCNDCGFEFAASANRIKAHINEVEGKGIRVCHGNANSNIDIEDNIMHSQRQIQADDAKDQERIQVGSSFVSNVENEDLQMMKRYVFECVRPEDKAFTSPLSYLTQQDFITLKPEAHVDSLVIDIFVEMLTDIERKKKAVPSNWYLPITFSDKALEGHSGRFLHFVHGQKLRENYMSDLESCEKIFIPVHVGARPYGGHFYLYIVHVKNKEIELWDSLPNTSVAEIGRHETAKKLLLALEKLFEEAVLFTKFHLKMANDILLQPNGFDCGIFVINYMEQSDNYAKRNPSFQFNSQKERDDLALKLLDNGLNQEKQNLYAKAREHYAQVEQQCGNKKLRVDVGSELDAEYDVSDEEGDGLENGSPCVACKLLQRRCVQDCLFAPYFPADEPFKFASVHKVFGASNVNKMLQELPEDQRSDAVNSMVYEANARIRDPVYGCVGAISCLQQQIDVLQIQLALAQAECIHIRISSSSTQPQSSPRIDAELSSLFAVDNVTFV